MPSKTNPAVRQQWYDMDDATLAQQNPLDPKWLNGLSESEHKEFQETVAEAKKGTDLGNTDASLKRIKDSPAGATIDAYTVDDSDDFTLDQLRSQARMATLEWQRAYKEEHGQLPTDLQTDIFVQKFLTQGEQFTMSGPLYGSNTLGTPMEAARRLAEPDNFAEFMTADNDFFMELPLADGSTYKYAVTLEERQALFTELSVRLGRPPSVQRLVMALIVRGKTDLFNAPLED